MQERRSYYVYALFKLDGEPCYIGKGCGGRVFQHTKLAAKGRHANPYLSRLIKKSGRELPAAIIRDGLSEDEAFIIERALILAIGRINNGGPLTNLTDGGEGVSGFRHTVETKIIVGEKSRQVWSDPNMKDRIIDAQNAGRSTPEYRAKRSEISRSIAARSSPEERSAAAKERYSADQTLKNRISEATRRAMADPELRARLCKAQQESYKNPERRAKAQKSPETRAKISASKMGRSLTAEHAAASKAGVIAYTKSPDYVNPRRGKTNSDEHRAKIGNAHRDIPLSAEHKAKVSASIKEWWVRRRARAHIEGIQQ